MKKIVYIIPFLLFACKNTSSEETKKPTSVNITKDPTLPQGIPMNEDCVFDTSSFMPTKEIINKFDPNQKFIWNAEGKMAAIPFAGGDTLYLSIGGCDHYSYSGVYKTTAEKFSDEKFLLNKTQWIAKNFFSRKFDKNYVKFISNKEYKRSYPMENRNDDTKLYIINTKDSIPENQVYNGFYFRKAGGRTEINISGYIN